MSSIRLYLDEDAMHRSLVFGLRERGIDVSTAAEAQMINRPDSEHLATAAASGSTLYSFNVADYARLSQTWISQGHTHAGIIVARQQHYSPGEELRRLLRLLSTMSAEQIRDRVEFLSNWS